MNWLIGQNRTHVLEIKTWKIQSLSSIFSLPQNLPKESSKSFFEKIVVKFLFKIYFTDKVEEAMFMKSKYGNAVLLDKAGYAYRSNLKKETKIYWRCRNSEKYKCPARAVTDGFQVMSWTGLHSHSLPTTKKKF